MKNQVRQKLVRRPYGEHGAGPAAAAHRASVDAMFVCNEQGSFRGRRVITRRLRVLARQKYLNGDYMVTHEVQHYCPGCCANWEETYEGICKDIIDEMEGPGQFNSGKWLGAEQAIDFHGEWICTHGLLLPAYKEAFGNTKSHNPSHLALEDGAADEFGDRQSVEEMLLEPTKDSTSFERQGTYRANALTWLESGPQGRVISMKQVHGVQQKVQRHMLANVGRKFELREMKRRAAGKPPNPRVLQVHTGAFTTPALDAYCKLIREEQAWMCLQDKWKMHSLSLAVYRSVAVSVAGTYQLHVCRNRTYPYKPFGMLQGTWLERLRKARELRTDFERCRTMVGGWADILDAFPTDQDLMSADFQCLLLFLADIIETDNGSLESGNAQLRRRVKAVLQSRALSLQDLSVACITGDCRAEAASVNGVPVPTVSKEVPATEAVRGGGGLQRAFISKHKDEFRTETGQIDFARANAAYSVCSNAEKEALVPAAKRAILARRDIFHDRQHRGLTGQGGPLSSFGGFRWPHIAEKEQRKASIRALVDDIDRCVAAQQNPRDEEPSSVQPRNALAILQQEQSICDVLANRVGGTVKQQKKAMRQVARLKASDVRKKEDGEVAEMRDLISKPLSNSRVDFNGIVMPSGGALRLHPRAVDLPLSAMVWSDSAVDVALVKTADFSSKAVAKGRRRKDCVAFRLLKAFQDAHKMIMQPQPEDELGELPKHIRPSNCYKNGFGCCLCQGRGILIDLCRRKFNEHLARLCPKDTDLRRWLKHGFIVIKFGSMASYFHAALVYLKPRRVTALCLEDKGRSMWGRTALDLQYNDGGRIQVYNDIDK